LLSAEIEIQILEESDGAISGVRLRLGKKKSEVTSVFENQS